MSASGKTNQEEIIVFESEHKSRKVRSDSVTRCNASIEEKVERDWSNLRASGLDYDYVDHLLELITAVEEGSEANTPHPSKGKRKIVATRSPGCGTNVLRLRLLME